MAGLKLTKNYQTYPEYKDSGVEWFGEIPQGWGMGPLRSVLRERKEKNTKLVSDNILSVMKDVGVIRYADKGDVGNKSSDSPENYKIVHAGDIVANSMNLVIGSVGRSKELGVTSSVYLIYYPANDEVDASYYHYLFRDKAWQKTLGRLGKGIMELRESIKAGDLKIEPVPLPPLATQTKIAAYLDEKTALIDQIIEKKRKLIELLREKRAAVINHAVTKGLDPNADLVESGVEWIGKIPRGWEIRRLKYVCSFKYGESLPSDTRTDGKVPVFGSNGPVGEHSVSNTLAPVVLVGRKGSYGAIRYSEVPVFAIDTVYFVDENTTTTDLLWLSYVLGTLSLGAESHDTGVPGLSREVAYNKLTPVPPQKEQNKISKFLVSEMQKNDYALSAVGKGVSLLSEFKSSLISHVVTGKINITT